MSDDQINNTTQETKTENSSGIFGAPFAMVSDDTNNIPIQDTSTQVSALTSTQNPTTDTSQTVKTQTLPASTVPVSSGVVGDNNSSDSSKKDLEFLGVTFVEEQIPQETNIFSPDSSFKAKEQEQLATIAQEKTQDPKLKPAQTENLVPETKDLEQDFSETFTTPLGVSSQYSQGDDAIVYEIQKLKTLHSELKSKASQKKSVVKIELEKLRTEKERLAQELSDIKELEETAKHIEDKLASLEQIDSEIDLLEKQAKEELL